MDKDQTLEPLNVKETLTKKPKFKMLHKYLPAFGVFLGILHALMMVLSNLFAKLCLVLPVFEIAIIRFMFQLVVVIPSLLHSKDKIIYCPKITALLVLRGFGGTSSMLTRFYASRNMPLGDSTVLLFTSPIFVAIFARIFLKERLHFIYFILSVFCLAGVILIARPTFIFGHPDTVPEYENILIPSLVAVLSAIISAVNLVILRMLGKTNVQSKVILFYLGIVGLIYSVIGSYLDKGFEFPFCKSIDYLYALAVGLVTTLAQKFVNEALRLERAFIISLARSSGILFGFLFQILIYALVPTALSFSGAAMITLSNVIIFLFNWFHCKKSSASILDEKKI